MLGKEKERSNAMRCWRSSRLLNATIKPVGRLTSALNSHTSIFPPTKWIQTWSQHALGPLGKKHTLRTLELDLFGVHTYKTYIVMHLCICISVLTRVWKTRDSRNAYYILHKVDELHQAWSVATSLSLSATPALAQVPFRSCTENSTFF